MRTLRLLLSCAMAVILSSSCVKKEVDEQPVPEPDPVFEAVNYFAYNALDLYYLWIDEIQDALGDWHRYDNPVDAVAMVRYKDAEGKDIDKWTQVIDDFESFTSSVAGVSTTLGLDFKLYYADPSKSRVCAIVTFVYAGSPAEQAGLGRGDVIAEVDGMAMTPDNYVSIVNERIFGGVEVNLKLASGRSVDLVPVKMYEEPVLTYKVFDCPGKKVAYLAYASFTLDSYSSLMEAFGHFKEAGASELILDLRYNSGGYVIAENTLASMIAPVDDVMAGSLFEQDVYNERMGKIMGSSSRTYLRTDYSFTSGTRQYEYNTAGLNPGFTKVYALVSGDTASASESLLVGLIPYMDVEIIGTRTYGKYCGGIMYGAEEWYEDYRKQLTQERYDAGMKNAVNWGIYMMVSRFADKNGDTPCMPDGFKPDFELDDDPTQPAPLGDPAEKMLAFALSRAGYPAPAPSAVPASETPVPERTPFQHVRAGVRILPGF